MFKIEVGLSMLYCLNLPFSHLVEELGKVDVYHIELFDESHHTLNSHRVRVLKKTAQDRGLKLTVHAPFMDINIASTVLSKRRTVLDRLKKSIRLADQLSARLWVFHPGLRTSVSNLYSSLEWQLNLQSVRDLLNAADQYGLRITIENTPEPFPFLLKSVEDFTRFYSKLGDVDLGLTLDVGHANVNGQLYDFIESFSDKIIHIHASDNDGTFDSHLGVGEGDIDWRRVADALREIDYQGVVIVESVKNIRESLETLQRLFSDI